MKIRPQGIYHVYNQGNNRQPIFFEERNYRYFLKKIKIHLFKHVDILAYCLMPNHFHLMIYTPEDFEPLEFSQSYKTLLSSYTRGINKQEGRTGSLFRQNSKAKQITDRNYALSCFRYILRNPVKDKLVGDLARWHYSSYQDYVGIRKGTLTNVKLATELLELPTVHQQLERFLNGEISEEQLKEIF